MADSLEKRLKRLHQARAPELSWTEFQTEAGLSKDTLGALTRRHGKRGTVVGGSSRMLIKLADHYKAPRDWLIYGAGDLDPADSLERLIADNPGHWSENAVTQARMLRDAGNSRSSDDWSTLLDALHGTAGKKPQRVSYTPPPSSSKIRSK